MRSDDPFPYSSEHEDRESQSVTVVSALVALVLLVLVGVVSGGPGLGENPAEYYARLLLFALLGELAFLAVAWIVGLFTPGRVVEGQLAFRAGTCLLIGAIFLAWATVLALSGLARGEHGLAVATFLLALGALDLLVLSILCFVRLRPEHSRPRFRLVRRFALLALPVWLVPGCVLLLMPATGGCGHHYGAQCINNVRLMSTILSERSLQHGWPAHGGKNFVLSLVADGVIDPLEGRNLEIFYCPVDGDLALADADVDLYYDLTPESLRERRFPQLTSYAGLRLEGREAYLASGAVPIIGCRHHDDGVVLGYSDGSARFMDHDDLGLDASDPIVFGPDSLSPLLRHLSE